MARIDEIGTGFRWLDGLASGLEGVDQAEGRDSFPDAGSRARADQPLHVISLMTRMERSENRE
jgi:hypothetical protein